jgi:hypothetical protein
VLEAEFRAFADSARDYAFITLGLDFVIERYAPTEVHASVWGDLALVAPVSLMALDQNANGAEMCKVFVVLGSGELLALIQPCRDLFRRRCSPYSSSKAPGSAP